MLHKILKLAQQGNNFCFKCGKRTIGPAIVHEACIKCAVKDYDADWFVKAVGKKAKGELNKTANGFNVSNTDEAGLVGAWAREITPELVSDKWGYIPETPKKRFQRFIEYTISDGNEEGVALFGLTEDTAEMVDKTYSGDVGMMVGEGIADEPISLEEFRQNLEAAVAKDGNKILGKGEKKTRVFQE